MNACRLPSKARWDYVWAWPASDVTEEKAEIVWCTRYVIMQYDDFGVFLFPTAKRSRCNCLDTRSASQSSSSSSSSLGSLRCHYQLVLLPSRRRHNAGPPVRPPRRQSARCPPARLASRMSNPPRAATASSTDSQVASDQTRSNEVGNAIRKATTASIVSLLTR